MTAGVKGIAYTEGVNALRRHGVHVPPDKPGAPAQHDVQCPNCSAHNPADMSLRIQSRMKNLELLCRNGCDQVRILQTIGFRRAQWVDPPPRRQGVEEHSGQVRMAYRLAKAYANRLIYVHGHGWYYWDGKRWKFDDCGFAERAVLDTMAVALAESILDQNLRKDVAKCETANGIAGVLRVAAALTEFARTFAQLDADPWQFNCDNGTVDLHTDELRPHDPRDYITKVARGTYDPEAKGPTFKAFLTRSLPDEPIRDYLQRCAGLSLLGKVAEHILPILTGTGANGKSVWYTAMLYALGDYASAADPELLMAREGAHPTGQMDLRGLRFTVASESDEGRQMNAGGMKRLTGGDMIKARYMHRDFVEFKPSHTVFLVTNHLPKVPGDDPAVWRRMRVIPFDVVIPPDERDPHLDEKLQVEADAVLAWAIAGWQAYRNGGLAEPPQVLAATGNYQKDNDAVARFIEDECVTSSAVLKATTTDLFNAWDRWRAADGAEQLSQKAFGQALDKRGYPAGKPSNGKRWRSGIALAVKAEA